MNDWKQRAVLAIRATRVAQVAAPVTITATVHRTTRAKADAHNVTPTIKAAIDAAVFCGVIEDDNDGIVRRLIIQPGPVAKSPTIDLLIEATPCYCRTHGVARDVCGCPEHDHPLNRAHQ